MSRFYRKPISTLPPRQRSYRRRRGRAWFVLWLVLLGTGGTAGWWMVFRRPVAPVVQAEATTPAPLPVEETAASPLEAAADPDSARVSFAVPVAKPTAQPPPTSTAPAPPAPATSPAMPEQAVEPVQGFRPRLPRDVFEAQIALTRDAICPGSIDGAWGNQTRAAIVAFQQKHGLRVTGQLDNTTREQLQLREPPLTTYTVTADDFLRLRPLPKGWLERSALDRLDYSTILELVAEKHWTNPKHLRRLNPGIDWEHVQSGMRVIVPRVGRAAPRTRPARVVIHLTDKTLELFDAESRLLAHFPCSIARRVEKRPVGELQVVVVAPDPNYTFNPETFPDSPEAQAVGRKLILQPGPNNPVGVAWIGLSVSNGSYGIHGSPEPEQIGRTESSGCFRLANWNARYLLSLVYVGMPVEVEL